MFSVHNIFSIFPLLFIAVSTNWTSLSNGTINLPGHIYKIHLNKQQTLNGRLTWNGLEDLDIYLFKQGSNILDNTQSFRLFISKTGKYQMLNYKSLQSEVLFIRVCQNDTMAQKLIQYNLQLITSTKTVNYKGMFHKNYSESFTIMIPNNIKFTRIGFRFLTNSQLAKNAILSSPISYPNLTISYDEIACVSNHHAPSFFVFLIPNFALKAYSLNEIKYSLEYFEGQYPNCTKNCPEEYQWNIIGQLCMYKPLLEIRDEMSLNTFFVIMFLIPIFGFIVLGLLGMCLIKIYKRCRVKLTIKDIQRRNLIKKFEGSQNNLEISESCSICLRQNCDVSLPCMHYFHEQCIKEWIKNKNICPLCRALIA